MDVIEKIKTANTGLRGDNVSCLTSLFYADNSAIGSMDHKWIENVNQHLCNFFRDCVDLKPNTEYELSFWSNPGPVHNRQI